MIKCLPGSGRLIFISAAMILLLALTRCATPQDLASSCKFSTAYTEGDSCLVSSLPVEDDFYKSGSYYLPCFEAVNVPTACMAARYRSGQVAIKMHIRDWQMEGKMTVYYPNGKRREERNYVNDNYGREYTTWYENGQVEKEVIPVDGLRLSKYTAWSQDGVVTSEGFYVYSDSLNRPLYDSIVNFWAGGKQMVKSGNGMIAHYFSNGRRSYEMPVVNGKAEGVMRIWDSTGIVLEQQQFAGGTPHGFYIKSDPEGRMIQKGFYNKGLKDSTWTEYYLTGAIRAVRSYKQGSECGLFCQWYENGQKSMEYHTSAGGKIEGEERQWHKNGQLKCAGTYLNGYRHGTFAWFNEDGSRDFERHYSEGREVGTTCYRNGKRLKKCPRSRFLN